MIARGGKGEKKEMKRMVMGKFLPSHLLKVGYWGRRDFFFIFFSAVENPDY